MPLPLHGIFDWLARNFQLMRHYPRDFDAFYVLWADVLC